jgi:uncharacterized protein (TIGR00251 family)
MKACTLRIKAVPNSPKDQIVAWVGDSLKVRVRAPPTDGKANERLCAFMAEQLSLPKGAVSVSSGASSREKRLAILGLSEEEARGRIPLINP